MRLTGSKNVLHFRLKCSKLRRFLGLRPRPRWGSLQRSSTPLVVRGFLPSAIAVSRLRLLIPISPPNKNTAPLAPQTQNPRTATCRKGSGRPRSVRSTSHSNKYRSCEDELICSQDGSIGNHLSTRRIST